MKIELPQGIQGDLTFEQFDKLCDHFGCSLAKTRSGTWIIESEAPVNFFWLGANIYNRTVTPLTISVTEKIAINEPI